MAQKTRTPIKADALAALAQELFGGNVLSQPSDFESRSQNLFQGSRDTFNRLPQAGADVLDSYFQQGLLGSTMVGFPNNGTMYGLLAGQKGSGLGDFRAYLIDLDTPRGAWYTASKILRDNAGAEYVQSAWASLQQGNLAAFFGNLSKAAKEALYAIPSAGYAVAVYVRQLWTDMFGEYATFVQLDDLKKAVGTIPLVILDKGTIIHELHLSGNWGQLYNQQDGFIAVPMTTPTPEGIRVRVSAGSQELKYLGAPLAGAYTNVPATKELSIKNFYLDLRPLMAISYINLSKTTSNQPVIAKNLSSISSDLRSRIAARLVDTALAYLETLTKPDPVLGRKHRLAMRCGNQRYGVPPNYLTLESFDFETIQYTPDGCTLLAQVNLELKEWTGLRW